MHVKDFDNWNEKKQEIQELEPPKFHQRDIWWCSIGVNIGNEVDGKNEEFKRPVLIIRKYNNFQALVIPLSTQIKENRLRYLFEFAGRKQNALLSQSRVIDTRRLTVRMGKLPPNKFKRIKEKFLETI
jgi:mRNA interferase MazF